MRAERGAQAGAPAAPWGALCSLQTRATGECVRENNEFKSSDNAPRVVPSGGSWAFEEGQPSFYHVQILHYTVLHSCLGDDSYLASKRQPRTSRRLMRLPVPNLPCMMWTASPRSSRPVMQIYASGPPVAQRPEATTASGKGALRE
ncbi:hypothetical protein AOLI_G00015590 [Acnodon oligacanthus]